MRTLKASILSLSLIAAFAAPAAAQTATFDDITSSSFSWFNSYKDLTWTNAYVIAPLSVFGPVVPSGGGYTSALSSGRYVLGNGGGDPLTISGSQFNLYGGVFSSAWRNGMTLNAVGSLNGTELYNRTFTLDWKTSQYLDLDMYGVDNIVFTTAGGTNDFPGWYDGSFAADNFEFGTGPEEPRVTLQEASVSAVPEPMTVSLMGIGLLAVGVVSARRKRVLAK